MRDNFAYLYAKHLKIVKNVLIFRNIKFAHADPSVERKVQQTNFHRRDKENYQRNTSEKKASSQML